MTDEHGRPIFALFVVVLALGWSSAALPQQELRLVVDDGKYSESAWSTQVAVDEAETYVVTSDVQNGIKIWELETGRLLTSFEGHSLEGDAYFDPHGALLVTTGDRKVKVWDVAGERLLKTLQQDFHSQFMNDVYVDSGREYLFAQRVKYGYDTGRVYRNYPVERYPTMYFHRDRYYVFDREQGTLARYDCLSDERESLLTLEDYHRGDSEYFNQGKGVLFIGYPDGVRAVDVAGGTSDYILYDRSETFENNGRTTAFDWTADQRYVLAGSNMSTPSPGHLVLLEKVDRAQPFAGNVRELFRQDVAVGEILCLQRSPRCLYTTVAGELILLDLPAGRVVWQSTPKIKAIGAISLTADGFLNIAFGTEPRVNRNWFEREYDFAYDQYFDELDENWGRFKADLKESDLPAPLQGLWRERQQYARVRLEQGLTLLPFPAEAGFESHGSEASPTEPVAGQIESPSARYYATEESFDNVSVYEGDALIAKAPNSGVVYHVEYSPKERYVAFGGSGRRAIVVDLTGHKVVQNLNAESYVTTLSFSNDERYLFSGSLKNEILMWDVQTGKQVRKFTGSNGGILNTEVSADDRILISVAADGALRLWNIATGELLLTAYYNYDGDYVAFTPSGYFEKSEDFDAVLWRKAGQTFEFEQFFEDYYRPGLVAEVMSAEAVARPQVTLSEQLSQSPPPAVEITAPSAGERFATSEVEVVVAVTDTGGGVDEVVLTHNGKRVAGDARGISVDAVRRAGEQRFRITLLAGENVLSASAFSKGRIESGAYRVTVRFDGTTPTADVHIVAIGINKYRNSRYDLNYARTDAEGVQQLIAKHGKALFRDVHLHLLYDEDATAEHIRAALQAAVGSARPQDVFAFYFAGHGVTGKNAQGQMEFFIVPTEVTQLYDDAGLLAHGISAGELAGYSRSIAAQKQVFVFDACESGGVERAFAMRGAAEEKALAQLARSAGIHVLAATGTEQFASEFKELGHGLFTYVMLDALSGAADGAPHDGKVTVHELKAFVEDRVPEMTERFRGQQQYPVTYSRGNDFPLLLPGG